MSKRDSVISVLPGDRTITGEPQVQWKNGEAYPVVELGRIGVSGPLPGEEILLDRLELERSGDVLLLSERSGGSRSLLHWWKAQLGQSPSEAWVMIEAKRWDPLFFEWSPGLDHQNGSVNEARRQIEQALVGFGKQQSGAVERAKALAKWARSLKTPFTLMIRDLHSIGQDSASIEQDSAVEMASAFRSIRDKKLAPNLRIVLVSHSEANLGDLWDRSGYLPLLRQWRVTGLNHREAEALAVAVLTGFAPKGAKLRGVIESILRETGGQTLLLQQLLRILQQRVSQDSKRRPITAEDVAEAGNLLRDNAPDPCRIWVEDLEQLLTNNKDLVSTLRSYVVGHSLGQASFPPAKEERPLFVSGWLGLNRMERWGIRSDFHAHLARPVLDAFRVSKVMP